MPNFRKVVLVDPSHDMPLPAPHNRLFDKAGETVDVADAFWIARLADGSVEEVAAEVPSMPASSGPAPLALPSPAAALMPLDLAAVLTV